jgi:hypothetical protein
MSCSISLAMASSDTIQPSTLLRKSVNQIRISSVYIVHVLRMVTQLDARSTTEGKANSISKCQPIIGNPSAFGWNLTPHSALISSGVEWVHNPWSSRSTKPCKRSFDSLVYDSCELVLGSLLRAYRTRSLGRILTRPCPGTTCRREQTVLPLA